MQIGRELRRNRREFWNRCYRLWAIDRGTYDITDSGVVVVIRRWLPVNRAPYLTADVRPGDRRAITGISSTSPGDTSSYWKAIDVALPILRRHMVLDDLAEAAK